MKSTFRVLFFLKRDKVKKNGNMPIMARITIDGKLVEKPLNFDPFGHARFAHLFVLYD